MDTIKKLCEGQNSETRRRIIAAYYRGCADGAYQNAAVPYCFRGKMFLWWSTWIFNAKIELWNRRRAKAPIRRYLPALRKAAQEIRQRLLPAVPRGLDARMAKNAPADCGAEIQGQLPIVCQHLSPAWQADPEAMSDVRGPEGPDAPRGLQQAAGGDVAVPAVPSRSTQENRPRLAADITLLRNQAE